MPHLEPPPEKPDWVRKLDEMASPEAQAWHTALAALRAVNALAPVREMFAGRYTRIDHAIVEGIDRAAR
jgi:hypothetical protein